MQSATGHIQDLRAKYDYNLGLIVSVLTITQVMTTFYSVTSLLSFVDAVTSLERGPESGK